MTPPVPVKPARRPTARRARGQRGQAMLEYSILNWVLVCALILMSTYRFPTARDTDENKVERKNVIEMFLDAYQTYYDSFYFVLNLPFP